MSHIEDYALIGDLRTAALVGRDGSIDWLCLPNFDSAACFAALLGGDDAGLWHLAPSASGECTGRRYREDTLILETTWETPTGTVRVIDAMPPRGDAADIVRVVEGLRGAVEMSVALRIRFDYGHIVPWVRKAGEGISAIAGPDSLWLRTPVELTGKALATEATFTVHAGERVPFVLTYRRLPEQTLDWLAGYEGSRPVRTGNAASEQLQLDVWGEVLDSLHLSREAGIEREDSAWEMQLALLDFLEATWTKPDNGLWEIRGERKHFVHSKVMAWVGFDRAVKAVEKWGLPGPVQRWRAARDRIHEDVCRHGFDAARNTFTQFYGSHGLDASLLLIPVVGFLPWNDARVAGTVDAVQDQLLRGGFLLRYDPAADGRVDGLAGDEGTFTACTFWLAEALAGIGRHNDARELFGRLLNLRNDVGLLSEEYDPETGHHLGNTPQAYSHVGLINAATRLTRTDPHPSDTERRDHARTDDRTPR